MRLSVRKYVRKDISGYVTCITCIYALYGICVNVDECIFVAMRHHKCCMIEFKCVLDVWCDLVCLAWIDVA